MAASPRLRFTTVAATLFGGWIFLVIAVAAARPGLLLEAGVIGAAGFVVVAMWARAPRPTVDVAAVAALAFAIPLLNTWPARAYAAAVGSDQLGWRVVVAPASLVVGAAAILSFRFARRASVPRLLLLGAALLVVGAGIAAVAARSPDASLAAWLCGIVVPVVAGVVVLRARLSPLDAWRVLATLLGAAIVPMTMAIAAYLLEFGTPTSGHDLVLARQDLFRPFLLQEITFGNISHLSDLAILLLAPAAIAAGVAPLRIIRGLGVIVTILCVACLLLTLVRSAVGLAGIALIVSALVVVLRGDRRALVPVAATVVLVLVCATGPVRDYFFSLATVAGPSRPTLTPTKPRGGGSGGAPPPGPTQSHRPDGAASEEVRLQALRMGLRILRRHLPFGVGPGEYAKYDPVRTSAHSLPIQTLAEDGVLGGAGLALVVAAVLASGIALWRRRGRAFQWPAFAAALGVLFFFAEGAVNGSLFAVGTIAVWGLAAAVEIALTVGAYE